MFEWVTNPEAWLALATLTALEIVLGIDNIIFISIVVSRLPKDRRNSARIIELALAMVTRILLLLSLAWTTVLQTIELKFRTNIHERRSGKCDDLNLLARHNNFCLSIVR